MAAALAALECERRGRSGSITKPPRSLLAEMECEEEESEGNSLGDAPELRAEVARACKRLKELSFHLRRGEDDSGLQSDCDESMPVTTNSPESEVRFFIFSLRSTFNYNVLLFSFFTYKRIFFNFYIHFFNVHVQKFSLCNNLFYNIAQQLF